MNFKNEKIDELINRIASLNDALTELQTKNQSDIIDNEQFLSLMKISRRTAQMWRDDGLISFSQVRGKIYYCMSDVTNLLQNNYKRAFHINKGQSR
jgi:hypothetical protein